MDSFKGLSANKHAKEKMNQRHVFDDCEGGLSIYHIKAEMQRHEKRTRGMIIFFYQAAFFYVQSAE